MNNFIKHPVTLAVIPSVFVAVVGYFGFVKESTNNHVETKAAISNLQSTTSEMKRDIHSLETQVNKYADIPPRVSQLEAATKEMQEKMERVLVNQGIQGESLKNIDEGVGELKFLVRNTQGTL